jgi:hypothetical protein
MSNSAAKEWAAAYRDSLATTIQSYSNNWYHPVFVVLIISHCQRNAARNFAKYNSEDPITAPNMLEANKARNDERKSCS